MGVIILAEGTGGTGCRFTLIRLLPADHEAVVVQDQVSRTGLLFGSAFSFNEDALAMPVRVNEGEEGVLRRNEALAVEGRAYSGDWFKSRSIQAQRFATVRSTRAALTVAGLDASGAPVVVSSIESPLETVVVTDENGKSWRGDNVRTGEKVTLRAVDQKVCNNWWRGATEPARSSMQNLLKAATWSSDRNVGIPGIFLATGAQPKGEPFATLPSIRWKEDRVVYLGPVTQLAAPPSGATQP
jgi:hypothetical protein